MAQETRKEAIRKFILASAEEHPSTLVRVVADQFGISRQAVHKNLAPLIESGQILASGATRARRYALGVASEWRAVVQLADFRGEDVIWDRYMEEFTKDLPLNTFNIWYYGFGEMLNNVIDHSGSATAELTFRNTGDEIQLTISDSGVGIFHKIMSECGLDDERHAVLELSKGQLTTDPANHTGQGIFFSSRMFDHFLITSGETSFTHDLETDQDPNLSTLDRRDGTTVQVSLANDTDRVMSDVFDQFTSGDDYGFTKTVVPVRLAIYGRESLVSRSQAKKVLAGLDRFQSIVFDFETIEQIGQAFADEIFRVYAAKHPDMDLAEINTTEPVAKMIRRAKSG